ncbi:MAG: hypothetical protein UU48_C0005G0038, partial [Candidatus Uhrbacteria bacterium GW2011_GWF2_41_16]
ASWVPLRAQKAYRKQAKEASLKGYSPPRRARTNPQTCSAPACFRI